MPLDVSTTREVIEIINITLSHNQKFLGVLSGKLMPKEIEEMHQLHVYEVKNPQDLRLIRLINLSEGYRHVSKCFEFHLGNQEKEIIFITKESVIIFDYIQDFGRKVLIFKNQLRSQPDYI